MAPDIAVRTSNWYSDVVDLLQHPHTTMPVRDVLALLAIHFDTGASWHGYDPGSSFDAIIEPNDALDSERGVFDDWRAGGLFDCHPLFVWNLRTGGVTPQTKGRVPIGLVRWSRRMILEKPLRRLELDQQLSIVYRLGPRLSQSFVLGRGGRDFSDDDVLLATVVQHAARALDTQVAIVRRLLGHPGSPGIAGDVGLTGRELAVLQLVDDGLSTRAAARTLGCSPRTLEKHLERVYRKLGVRDRLNAVRLARSLGLLGPSRPSRPSRPTRT